MWENVRRLGCWKCDGRLVWCGRCDRLLSCLRHDVRLGRWRVTLVADVSVKWASAQRPEKRLAEQIDIVGARSCQLRLYLLSIFSVDG